MPFSIPSLQFIFKLASLRDEAARASALLPQINQALAEPVVYRKLEIFAPIAQEVCLILASGMKDLAPDLMMAATPEHEAEYEEEVAAQCAAMGADFSRLKEFVKNLKLLAEQLKPYLVQILPWIPVIL